MSRKTDKKDIRWVRNTVAFAKLFVFGIILIGIPLILILFYRDTLLSTDFWSQLPDRLARHSLISFLVLIVLQTIQIIICILPGQPIQLASSYMYGVIGGYCISIIGAIIGCLITYRLAHFLGVDAMHIIFGEEKVQNYMKKLNSGKALAIVFLIYLVPGIPKDLMSYIAGISNIELKLFLLVSTLGRSPGILGSLLIGYFWARKNYIGIGIVAVIMLLLFGWCVRNRERIVEKIEEYED